jgi:hypothetical protein
VASKKKKIIKMLKKINNKDFDDNKRYISLNKVKSEYNESIMENYSNSSDNNNNDGENEGSLSKVFAFNNINKLIL